MITGKIPTGAFIAMTSGTRAIRINVDVPVESLMDWGMLGYYVGDVVGERIPVLVGKYGSAGSHPAQALRCGGGLVWRRRDVSHRGCDARGANLRSGRRPEAQCSTTFTYGKAEQRRIYETLNARGQDTNVDYVMLGCPHAALEQIQEICRCSMGKKINSGVRLWVFTSRAIRAECRHARATARSFGMPAAS